MRAIKILVPVLVLAVAACVTAAPPSILLLSEQCTNIGTSVAYYPTVLATMGLTFTETNNNADFYAALTNGTQWDLILVDEYSDDLESLTLNAIENHIAHGGSCIVSYWDLDLTLAGALGADVAWMNSYSTPIPVLRWEPTSPLFTTPNAVADLTPIANTCSSDGFYLQAGPGATAVAGYTPAPTDNQAAIIIGNEGRTILLGITPGLFGPDMEKLLENCITFVNQPRPFKVTYNSLTPAIGSTLTIDVAVQPLTQAFDAWGCIFGPGASAYSFTLGNPTALRSGTSPLVQNIPGLPAAYNTQLLNITIPAGVSGVYTVAVELVPANLDPVIPIKGYAAVQTVTVP